VQVRRLDNEQLLWLRPDAAGFTDTSYTAAAVASFPQGPALVTVGVNGLPGVSQPVDVVVVHRVYVPLTTRRL